MGLVLELHRPLTIIRVVKGNGVAQETNGHQSENYADHTKNRLQKAA